MKNNAFFTKTLVLISFCFLFSCGDDDDNSSDNLTDAELINEVNNNVQQGTWRITNYTDDGNVETNDFSGYNFTFEENGTLIATNGEITHTGSWEITTSDSSDDDDSAGSDDIDFNIYFPVDDDHDFEDLNDDWDILSQTNNKLELVDVSGGDGDTDELTFERN